MAQEAAGGGSGNPWGNWFFFQNWWGRRFVIFSAIVVILAFIGLLMFDKTDDKSFKLLHNPYVDRDSVSGEEPDSLKNDHDSLP